jgi:hypothetical protein
MLAAKAEWLTGPQPSQYRQALVQFLGSNLGVSLFAKSREIEFLKA